MQFSQTASFTGKSYKNMHLKHGSVLQGGKYKIEKLLGQGGFGITYLAVQTCLDRKVAIKEFFMKEHCNRDVDTSHVSVPSVGSRELVAKFKEKFIKEAQMISGYKHPNIVIIYDVFEENGTAYYVMEYHGGSSLSSLYLPLSSEEASGYIRQVASALSYLHDHNTMHLDVKPSNVLIDSDGNAVLIDFGVSKRYDQAGNQTSSTPVGISHGYAPGEQYQQGTLAFSPSTDIYALGATFYKLVTGDTPPDQNEVNENGLPPFPATVPASIAALIEKAMQPRRKDRPQSIAVFLGLLDDALAASTGDEPKEDSEDDASTVIFGKDKVDGDSVDKTRTPSEKKKSRRGLWWLLAAVIMVGVGVFAVMSSKSEGKATVASTSERAVPQHELDKAVYDSLMTEVSSIALDDKESCNKAIKLYGEALVYEEKYVATEYRSMFFGGASEQIRSVEDRKKELESQATEAQKLESDLRSYNSMMDAGSEFEKHDATLQEAKSKYQSAKELEAKWPGHSSKFDRNASSAMKRVESRITELKEDQAKLEAEKAKLAKEQAEAERKKREVETEQQDYNSKISAADKKSRSDERSLKEAKKLYEEAAKYETNYKGTEYASFFVKGASARAKDMQSLIDNIQKSKKQPALAPSPKTSGSSPIASTTGTHKGHEWVDLGLSVKWATYNVGASTPGDYGNYYAWGETSTKSNYDYGNCASIGKSWGDIGGDSSRDAAKANWGGSWRMPTEAEFQELINNCTWTWTTHNGHKGYKVTGPNGNSIFLPAAGYRLGDTLCLGGEYGNYLSSTPNDRGTIYACYLRFDEGGWGPGWNARDNGRSVRPVLED